MPKKKASKKLVANDQNSNAQNSKLREEKAHSTQTKKLGDLSEDIVDINDNQNNDIIEENKFNKIKEENNCDNNADNTGDDNSLTDSDKKKNDAAIGHKIHQLRLAKGYSQRKLARLAGLTNTAISSIERNKVSPAINTLNALLAELDSDLATFFSEGWEDNKPKIVVRAEELIELSEPSTGVSLKQVYNHSLSKNLGFLIETYQPNSATEEKITHEGEEIGTVIEGKIIINIDDASYILNEGDSYVIDTSHPHTFINPTAAQTRIISAHTPATF